jgi:hypothetical protein
MQMQFLEFGEGLTLGLFVDDGISGCAVLLSPSPTLTTATGVASGGSELSMSTPIPAAASCPLTSASALAGAPGTDGIKTMGAGRLWPPHDRTNCDGGRRVGEVTAGPLELGFRAADWPHSLRAARIWDGQVSRPRV